MVSAYGHDQTAHGRQQEKREQHPSKLSAPHQCQKKGDHNGSGCNGGTQKSEPHRSGLEGLDTHVAGCTHVHRNNQHRKPGGATRSCDLLLRTSRISCRSSLVTVQSRSVNKLILAVPAAIALTACGVATTAAPSRTAALTAARQPLSCRAHMSNAGPGDRTTTVVHVRTQASVKVFTVAFYKTVRRAYFVRAGSDGQARVPYYVSGATPGRKVEVVVTVVRRHSASTCSTSFTPRRLASTSPSPSPSPRRHEAHQLRLHHIVPPRRAPLPRLGATRVLRRAIATSPASTAQTLITACTA